VVTPLANEHVKKFALEKSNDAVFVVIVGNITTPRNDPDTIVEPDILTFPNILVDPLKMVDPETVNEVVLRKFLADNVTDVGLNTNVESVAAVLYAF
jgi:hypothetical protein